MPITWSRPSERRLDAVVARMTGQEVTYGEAGATQTSTLPSGYRHDRCSVVIGHGDAVFRRGQDALRRWEAHRGAGAVVWPAEPSWRFGSGRLSCWLRAGSSMSPTTRTGSAPVTGAYLEGVGRYVASGDEPSL